MRRILIRLVLLALIVGLAGLWWTRPEREDASVLAGLSGDVARGEQVFLAGGCASCHMEKGATGDARLVLSGGQGFASPFGTFRAPNISPDPNAGIGDWSALDLLNAMRHGTTPDGQHYFPAFPYTSYAKATAQDILDLHTYLMTLPETPNPSLQHEVGFPFNIRAGLGLWKLLYLRRDWVLPDTTDPDVLRGRYLVEALGHCAECHTPRGILGGLRLDAWLTGAPNPEGRGQIPDITPTGLDWSNEDIVYYLETGFTPEFDSAGGHMADVVTNMAALPPQDRLAIAAYLRALASLP